MSSENVVADPVRLQYTLSADDLLDGFVSQHRRIRRPWYVRWLSTVLTVGIIVVVFVSSVPFGNRPVVLAVVLVALVIFAVGLSLLLGRLFDGSRWLFRLQVRQLMRANPMLSLPMQADVSEAGVEVNSPHGGSATKWSWTQFPRHVETDRSFVLLASERRGAAVFVLPKRGIAGSDLTLLRALLSAYTRQLT